MQMMKKVDKVAQMILEDMMENMSLDCFLKSKTVMKVIIVEVIIGVQSIGKCKEKSFTCENCLMACMICFILSEPVSVEILITLWSRIEGEFGLKMNNLGTLFSWKNWNALGMVLEGSSKLTSVKKIDVSELDDFASG